MSFIGNIIWVVFGGFVLFLEYLLAGLVLCLTIIGIPFGLQVFKLASLALWPFGRMAVQADGSSLGCLNLIMNLIWIIFGGLVICIEHVVLGLLFCVTIIGIPFGLQHFKLASVALLPFGRTIVSA
ncbi:MAG: YccF domain-containing protein [Bacteroidaceae bacterium]|nr:YccF domain-containing protein [Bacteroidaceae bacterium]